MICMSKCWNLGGELKSKIAALLQILYQPKYETSIVRLYEKYELMQLVKFGQSNIRENACSLEIFIQAENVKM